jgi:histidine phosphotransfer protein HptB
LSLPKNKYPVIKKNSATELTELCYKLQEICRTGHIHQHEQLIEEIKAECQAVNDQIQSLIA